VKLSVVVPAFNEERLLAQTLERLGAGLETLHRRGWSSELIVCDNNSTDRTPDIARAAGAIVVHEPVNHIARARNRGAAQARGDWLLFVDADSAPSAALLGELVDAIEAGRCIGGGCTIAMPNARPSVRVWVTAWNAISRTMSWAAGAFIFCEARAFRSLGGFNEALYAGEEIDLSRRLKRVGRVLILKRHPLHTSGRKADLYAWHEHARFLLRVLFTGGRALRRREQCDIWYDGRR
jgi:glycosyltransferase involved in cell wall biosynthesis